MRQSMDHGKMPQPSVHGVHLQQDTKKRTKWKFYTVDTTFSRGRAEETTVHMLKCSQLADPCSLDDLIPFNDVGKQCVEHGKHYLMTRRR